MRARYKADDCLPKAALKAFRSFHMDDQLEKILFYTYFLRTQINDVEAVSSMVHFIWHILFSFFCITGESLQK